MIIDATYSPDMLRHIHAHCQLAKRRYEERMALVGIPSFVVIPFNKLPPLAMQIALEKANYSYPLSQAESNNVAGNG